MNAILRGAVAGAAATGPMTLVFAAGHATGLLATPPPKHVTSSAARQSGLRAALSGPAFTSSWLAAHFAFGTACGALYPAADRVLPRSPAAAGLAYGAAIWATNYALALPALGLYPPPWRDDRSRAAVTVVAHAVYGLALAAVARRAH